MKHTIPGAGGSVGNILAYELLKTYKDVWLVSRNKYWIPRTEAFKADLTSYEETLRSIDLNKEKCNNDNSRMS